MIPLSRTPAAATGSYFTPQRPSELDLGLSRIGGSIRFGLLPISFKMKTGLICLLSPSLFFIVGAWNHISEARFRQALRNEYTLAACKLSSNHPNISLFRRKNI